MPPTSTLAALDAEWRTLATAPSSRAALIRWGRRQPLIAGLADLDELLALRRNDGAAGTVILQTLAELAPRDVLAARVLLQALKPGLVAMARVAGNDDPAAIDEIVSLAWERIRTYPTTRVGSVAANVVWDVRKRYRAHRRIEAPNRWVYGAKPVPGTAFSSSEDEIMARLHIPEIAAARRDGVISDSSLRLVVRTRVADEPLEDIAAEENVTVHCLMTRRSRAERQLRAYLEPVA